MFIICRNPITEDLHPVVKTFMNHVLQRVPPRGNFYSKAGNAHKLNRDTISLKKHSSWFPHQLGKWECIFQSREKVREFCIHWIFVSVIFFDSIVLFVEYIFVLSLLIDFSSHIISCHIIYSNPEYLA